MKRFFIISLALAAVAVGCTKSEVTKAPGHNKEIKFNTYVGKAPMTKAVSGDLAYLQSFTAEETPAFHVNAFLHAEVGVNENTELLEISTISLASAYMDKDVWWVSNTASAGIPEETATLKVIFSVSETQPELTGAYSGAVPDGWVDAYTPNARWFATSTELTTTGEDGVTTTAWSEWAVTEITEDNNTNNLGSWDYPGTVYWPDANSSRKLAFSAYSLNVKDDIEFTIPGETEGSVIETPYSDFTYTVPAVVAEQNDLLVTPLIPNQGITPTGERTTVGLTFKHLLSRVGFSLIANRDDEDIDITIKSVVVNGPFPSKGTVELKSLSPAIVALQGNEHASYSLFQDLEGGAYEYCEWESKKERQPIYANMLYTPATTTQDATTGEETTVPESYGANEAANPANRYMMIIPTTLGPDAHILVNYQLTDATPQTAKISLANWKFEAGKSYDFVFKVSTSAIGFYVEVTPWDSYFPTEENTGIYTLTPEIVDTTN